MIDGMSESTTRSLRRVGRRTDGQPNGKQRILKVAGRLFAANGFFSVSAAEIAKEAGVAHGLLFHHFGSMEELYAEVSRAAARHMDEVQLASFRGKTARDQIASFLRAHLRSVKERQGDALSRARSQNLAINSTVAQIWESSRQHAIERICEALDIREPSVKVRVCLRAWIGFHDQLVIAWLADGSVKQTEVMEWSLQQLDHLASEVLKVDLGREIQRDAARGIRG